MVSHNRGMNERVWEWGVWGVGVWGVISKKVVFSLVRYLQIIYFI